MTDVVPMLSFLATDYGNFELPQSVADKICAYPKTRYWNPYSEEMLEVTDLNHPPMKRYYRIVCERMKREWLKS